MEKILSSSTSASSPELSKEQMRQRIDLSARRLERFLIERRGAEQSKRWTPKELQLIGLLKEYGPKDTRTLQALNSWVDAHECRAYDLKDPLAFLEFGIIKAQLYRDAGFVEEANEEIRGLVQCAVSLRLDQFSYVIEDELR